jgi:hypothetical protein
MVLLGGFLVITSMVASFMAVQGLHLGTLHTYLFTYIMLPYYAQVHSFLLIMICIKV